MPDADYQCFLWYNHSHVLSGSQSPHFHAEYNGQNATFDFDGNLQEGEIDSRTAKVLIKKWARLHKTELAKNWENMRQRKQFLRIEPLK
jgi:hypothetical protein